jgi:fatty acid desaturase
VSTYFDKPEAQLKRELARRQKARERIDERLMSRTSWVVFSAFAGIAMHVALIFLLDLDGGQGAQLFLATFLIWASLAVLFVETTDRDPE